MYETSTIVRGLDPGETYVFRVVSVDGTLTKVSESEEIHTYPTGNQSLISASCKVITKFDQS